MGESERRKARVAQNESLSERCAIRALAIERSSDISVRLGSERPTRRHAPLEKRSANWKASVSARLEGKWE